MKQIKLISLIPNAIPIVTIGSTFYVRKFTVDGCYALLHKDEEGNSINPTREYYLYNHEYEIIEDNKQ